MLRSKTVSRRSAAIRLCKVCGTNFRPFHRNDIRRGKYCSRKCWKSDQRRNEVVLVCQECKKFFTRHVAIHRLRKTDRLDRRLFCSKLCFVRNNRTESNPLRRQAGELTYHHHSKAWKQKSRAWLNREKLCVPCGKKAKTTDHIIPFSAICKFSPGSDPDAEINLMALCRICHGTKTGADRHLFQGDLLRFRQMLAPTWPMDRVESALKHYGFIR